MSLREEWHGSERGAKGKRVAHFRGPGLGTAGAFCSQKPPLLYAAPLLGHGSTGHCPPTWEFTLGQLCPTHPHVNSSSSRGTMLLPTPCESNGALGITDSPVHPPMALPWLKRSSKRGDS